MKGRRDGKLEWEGCRRRIINSLEESLIIVGCKPNSEDYRIRKLIKLIGQAVEFGL